MNYSELRRAIRATKDEREKLDIYRDYCKSFDYSLDAISADFEAYLNNLTLKDCDTEAINLLKEIEKALKESGGAVQLAELEPLHRLHTYLIIDYANAITVRDHDRPEPKRKNIIGTTEQLSFFISPENPRNSFAVIDCLSRLVKEYSFRSNIKQIKQGGNITFITTQIFKAPFNLTSGTELDYEKKIELFIGKTKTKRPKEVLTLTTISYMGEIVEYLSSFDFIVCVILYNLVDRGYKDFTARQVCRFMNGKEPNSAQVQKVYDSVARIRNIDMKVDNRAEHSAYKWVILPKNVRLLPIDIYEMRERDEAAGENNYHVDFLFHVNEIPPLLVHGKATKQAETIPLQAIQFPVRADGHNYDIGKYLLDIVVSKRLPPIIKLSTLYEKIELTEGAKPSRSLITARARARETAKKIMTHFETTGLIKSGSVIFDNERIKFERDNFDFTL